MSSRLRDRLSRGPWPLAAPRRQRPSGQRRQRGQAMLEFALIVPLLMLVVVGIIEFALAFNATLGVNRASQVAALVAAEAGGIPGADCLILQSVEADVNAPADRREITTVEIQRTNPSGVTVYARNRYTRGGTTTCTMADGTTMTVPYTATMTSYPASQRCSVLKGCPTLTPARSTVDTIGIDIGYSYRWRTPLGSIMNLVNGTGSTSTFTFDRRSAFRMEPQI